MRRADMALGNDGNIGLPYWGWDEVDVDGEVFPKILRERFERYAENMFPDSGDGKAARLGDSGLVAPSESRLRRLLRGKGEQAQKTLDTAQHWQHACTRESNANRVRPKPLCSGCEKSSRCGQSLSAASLSAC